MTGAGSPAEPPGAVPGQPSPGPSDDLAWRKLGAEPGLCGACRHAKLNETRRGTAYVRCTRAGWDARLPRYPTLPVVDCTGFQPH
jgi:propionyl-CoA synthetase